MYPSMINPEAYPGPVVHVEGSLEVASEDVEYHYVDQIGAVSQA